MILIVGLGNPDIKYKNTRHNIGFRIIDELGKKKPSKEVRFFKPLTFMNNSGKAVKELTKRYTLNLNNLIVVHDDIDLPLGKIRISKNRGAGGHKGVESIIKELGTKNFYRIRIGICPQTGSPSQVLQNKIWEGKPKNVEKFVLQRFTKNEEKILKEVIKEVVKVLILKIL